MPLKRISGDYLEWVNKMGNKSPISPSLPQFMRFNGLIAGIFFYMLLGELFAAQETVKTARVKVGEKAPLTETLKKANEEGKFILLTLLPAPTGCSKCDEMTNLIQDEAAKKGDVVYIIKGGQDMLGAVDKETVELKRSYGFVTMGAAWTFIIDKDGVLRKILIGAFNREEMKDMLDGMIRRKE